MPLNQTPDLYTPDESAYHTPQRTYCHPKEPPSYSSTRANQGTDERRTLAFDSSAESQGEESVPRPRSKSRTEDAKVSSTQHPPRSLKSSTSRTSKTNAKASPTRHLPRSSTKSKSHKRRSSSSWSGDRSTSRDTVQSNYMRKTRIHVSNSEVTSSTYSSSSEEEEETLSKLKHPS